MLRTFFHLAAGLSFLLCITASIGWIRSYWVTDRWLSEMSPAGSRSTLFSERGWIKFLPRCYQDPQSKEVFSISFVGAIGVPYAMVVVLTAVLPIVWAVFRSAARIIASVIEALRKGLGLDCPNISNVVAECSRQPRFCGTKTNAADIRS